MRCFETEFRNSLHSQQYTLVSSLVSGIDKKLRLARDAMVASSRHLPYAALAAPELAQLRTFGCDDVQGPLVARPMPAADMEHFLRERR